MRSQFTIILLVGLIFITAFTAQVRADLSGSTANGSIVGTIKDEFGRSIINIDLSVFAYRQGKWIEGAFDKATGDYKIMNLPPGDWILGAHTGPESGFSASGINLPVTVLAASTLTQDIVLKRLGGIISGRALKFDGMPLSRAVVKATDFLSKYAKTLLATETDLNGAFRFLLPAGSYILRAFSGSEDIVDPEPAEVVLHGGEVAAISLVFGRPNGLIYGQVKIGGHGVQAPVWAWSDTGRYAETQSDTQGFYRLKVKTNDRWHLTADKDINRLPYQSAETVIDLENQNVERDLVLYAGTDHLPSAKQERFNAAYDATVRLENGMAVSVPARAVSSTELMINVSAATGSSQKDFKLVTPVYEVTITDGLGRPVTQLNKNAILEIPYSRLELPANVSEERLKIFAWDKYTSAWRPNGNSVANKGTIVGLTGYLANLGAGFEPEPSPSPSPSPAAAPAGGGGPSITSPFTPTGLAAALGPGQVASSQIDLNWTDNSNNEDGFRIHRRELPNGEFAEVAAVGVNVTSYSNQSLSANTSYQYRVAAFNAAGNSLFSETAQATTQAPTTGLPPSGPGGGTTGGGTTPDITPPNIANVTLDTTEAGKQIISWTTDEPATSRVLYRLSGGTAPGEVVNPNALNIHNFELNLPVGVYVIILSATDLALNSTITQEITLTAPSVPTTQTQIVQVGERTPQPSPSPAPAASVPASQLIPADVLFNRNLVRGSIGNDVRELQRFLNRNNFVVAVSGAGSPGLESRLLGPATAAALGRFQEQFRDQILSPVGLTRGTRTLGPRTRAFINGLR